MMTPPRLVTTPFFLALLLVLSSVQAGEKVSLEIPGGTVRGEVVKLTEKEVVLKVQGQDRVIPRVFLDKDGLFKVRKALLDPKDAKGHYELGTYAKQNGYEQEAEKLLLKAAQLDPSLKDKALGTMDANAEKAQIEIQPAAKVESAPAPGGGNGAANLSVVPAGGSGVDAFVNARIRSSGYSPAAKCTDEEFVRRAYLDVVGVIPTALAVKAFLADRSSDKRAKLIDQLLTDERYGQHWATIWGDLLREHSNSDQAEGTYPGSYRAWLKKALNDNLPYDKFVGALVTAEGRADQSGAVNFYLRDVGDRVETTNTVASAFMGTRMSCAQCHDHPFDTWEQKDFTGLQAFFSRTRVSMDMQATLERMQKEENVPAEYKTHIAGFLKAAGALKDEKGGKGRRGGDYRQIKALEAEVAKALGQEKGEAFRNMLYRYRVNTVTENSGGGGGAAFPWDPSKTSSGKGGLREDLVKFLVASPRFAEVQANRVWSKLMGRGLVEPVDDFRAKNPPTHPELLQYLAQVLVDAKFDSKALIKTIMLSDAYQRSSVAAGKSAEDTDCYSYRRLRRMTAEQLYDSIMVATGLKPGVAPPGAKAIGNNPMMQMQMKGGGDDDRGWAFDQRTPAQAGNFLHTFNQPDRDQLTTDRDPSVSIIQALELFNGRAINRAVGDEDSLGNRLVKARVNVKDLIGELYLATLSRYPNGAEYGAAVGYLRGTPTRKTVEDLHWALLNTREFMFIR